MPPIVPKWLQDALTNHKIDLDEVRRDPNNVFIKGGVRYQPDEKHAASYYVHGPAIHNKDGKFVKWNMDMAYCVNSKCLLLDPNNPVTVAHKTLPLGTVVKLSYGDNSMDAVVADRGPYAEEVGEGVEFRDFDLTLAGANYLFDGDIKKAGLTRPINVTILAVPRSSLANCVDKGSSGYSEKVCGNIPEEFKAHFEVECSLREFSPLEVCKKK